MTELKDRIIFKKYHWLNIKLDKEILTGFFCFYLNFLHLRFKKVKIQVFPIFLYFYKNNFV